MLYKNILKEVYTVRQAFFKDSAIYGGEYPKDYIRDLETILIKIMRLRSIRSEYKALRIEFHILFNYIKDMINNFSITIDYYPAIEKLSKYTIAEMKLILEYEDGGLL